MPYCLLLPAPKPCTNRARGRGEDSTDHWSASACTYIASYHRHGRFGRTETVHAQAQPEAKQARDFSPLPIRLGDDFSPLSVAHRDTAAVGPCGGQRNSRGILIWTCRLITRIHADLRRKTLPCIYDHVKFHGAHTLKAVDADGRLYTIHSFLFRVPPGAPSSPFAQSSIPAPLRTGASACCFGRQCSQRNHLREPDRPEQS